MALDEGGTLCVSTSGGKKKGFYSNCAVHLSSTVSSIFLYGYPFSFSLFLVIIFLFLLHGMTAWIILLLPPLCNTCGRLSPGSLHELHATPIYILFTERLCGLIRDRSLSIIIPCCGLFGLGLQRNRSVCWFLMFNYLCRERVDDAKTTFVVGQFFLPSVFVTLIGHDNDLLTPLKKSTRNNSTVWFWRHIRMSHDARPKSRRLLHLFVDNVHDCENSYVGVHHQIKPQFSETVKENTIVMVEKKE